MTLVELEDDKYQSSDGDEVVETLAKGSYQEAGGTLLGIKSARVKFENFTLEIESLFPSDFRYFYKRHICQHSSLGI